MGSHPFRTLRFAKTDKLFRHALICWMLMGFGNLMMIPIRVEYLTNPVYGLQKNDLTIAILTLVIPNVFRLLLNPLWGWLFDRINFFLLRSVLNLFFAVGILVFFSSESLTGMIVGQIFFGIAHAGGDIAWGMWVTKTRPGQPGGATGSVCCTIRPSACRWNDPALRHFYPANEYADGWGQLAPLIGFGVLASGLTIGSRDLSYISAGMIILSAALLIPTIRQTWKK